ncbi:MULTISPECIES: hypothetical protein [unclassified Mesorhizobium]|uniref:hypothetical protein n=1 Tax=unclassified Mesorhizobium TaxID=325217 RepID=UPI0003CE898C|nr:MULTISPECIES: hypothetical protein [unclassified Mesorhizobium]ESX18303.1 hypothetical protein X766_15125 [Mesorhizobium sp. LSJC255A00]ESX24197.1 hypothetical protein X765_27605 [Mesorhizobium sp. LSHC440B00]ESX31164.1 hypothetical protein X763_27915 [Mesorhizobium sp. LSHC432A00]ESX34544.1 hypothetical protein X764_28345 [Mesorhizobium sp. LSHC440A00]ESX68453.1 hypothetical protein X757_28710 [Mesorhizobium sp. LSHC414A00]
MKYAALYEFTEHGMLAFQAAMIGQIPDEAVDLQDQTIARRLSGTASFTVGAWKTSKSMAEEIVAAMGARDVPELLANNGLWAWLAFVSRDELFPENKDGVRKLGEVHRWYPSNLNDWQKGQRHLIRMPVLLFSTLGDNADHLLCGSPSVPGELREQLTSQQDMFHQTFQGAARNLYYDEAQRGLRRGAGGKRGGSARRLAKVRQQLDVTWDLFAMSSAQLLSKLPPEFDRFRRNER